METVEETIAALEDLIISYGDDSGSVAHVAFRAKEELVQLSSELKARDTEIERLVSILKATGVEVLR